MPRFPTYASSSLRVRPIAAAARCTGFELHPGIGWIQKPVNLCAAGMHAASHFDLGDTLRFHSLLDLTSDDALDGVGVASS